MQGFGQRSERSGHSTEADDSKAISHSPLTKPQAISSKQDNMKLLFSLVLLPVQLLLPTTHAFDDNSFDREESLIVGGSIASKGEFPWFVQSYYGECGGVLIWHDVMLSAGTFDDAVPADQDFCTD